MHKLKREKGSLDREVEGRLAAELRHSNSLERDYMAECKIKDISETAWIGRAECKIKKNGDIYLSLKQASSVAGHSHIVFWLECVQASPHMSSGMIAVGDTYIPAQTSGSAAYPAQYYTASYVPLHSTQQMARSLDSEGCF